MLKPAAAICPEWERITEGDLVDQPAARGIDQDGPPLHDGELGARRSGGASRA